VSALSWIAAIIGAVEGVCRWGNWVGSGLLPPSEARQKRGGSVQPQCSALGMQEQTGSVVKATHIYSLTSQILGSGQRAWSSSVSP